MKLKNNFFHYLENGNLKLFYDASLQSGKSFIKGTNNVQGIIIVIITK